MNGVTPYFSHDANARNDTKILNLRAALGAEGYGIYFMILERLRDSSDYMSVNDYNAIAYDLRVGAGLIKRVVEEFGLFTFTEDGARFYSESLLRRMEIKDEKIKNISEIRRAAALKRWNNNDVCKCNANAMQMQCKKNANDAKEKKSKEKKSKENKNKQNIYHDIDLHDMINDYTSDKELIDCLCVFVDNRTKGFDSVSFGAFLEQLNSFSNGDLKVKKDILRASILNGWQNIYPLKTSSKASSMSNLDRDYFMTSDRQTDGLTEDELKSKLGIRSKL